MKVYVESHGCTNNQGLGEDLKEGLLEAGLLLAERPEEADAVVLNTCTVKGRTERRMLRRIVELRESHGGSRVIVAGCMPTIQEKLIRSVSPDSPTFGTAQYDRIPGCLGSGMGKVRGRGQVFHRRGIGIVQVSTGCLGECTYCVVRRVKGTLRSYSPDKILGEIRNHRSRGAHEVWLTSQDLASYGADGGNMRLPELLRAVLSEAGTMRIRLGMMNPDSLRPILPEILTILGDDRIYRFAHLPIQSGSDRVLNSMRRKYTSDEWAEIVDELRSNFPGLSISTDLIVGYPTETPDDFDESVELVSSLKPDMINLSRYEPRPGTELDCHSSLGGRSSGGAES